MKRNAHSSSGVATKRICFSEDTMKDSSFSPDSIPKNVFPLGQNNYVAISDFSDVIRVHIRYYKTDFSGCLKPTKRGITLTTSLWQSFSSAMDLISETELKDMTIIANSLLVSEKVINNVRYISIQRFFQKSDLSHKFVSSVCLMSEAEWQELKKLRKEITSFAVQIMFGRVFQGLLLCEVQRYIPSSFIGGDCAEADLILTTSMSELLAEYLKSNIEQIFQCIGCEMNLGNQLGHECVTQNNEIRARIYSERALLNIDLCNFVKDFIEKNIKVCNYINECFVKSLNMSNIIKNAVDLYVASDPNPLKLL